MTARVALPLASPDARPDAGEPRRRRSRVWLVLLLAAAAHAGCGTRAFVRPTGPGLPAPDAAGAWVAASAACSAVRSYVGNLSLTGRIGDQRIRGLASATIDVAIDAVAQLAIEARISGQVAFRLGGTADRAVLWLRDDNRVVTAGAADLLAALVGAGFPPSRLREALAGCPAAATPTNAMRIGGDIIANVADAVAQLRRDQDTWRVRSWWFADWDVVYGRMSAAGPEQVTISSRAGVTPAVRLSFRVNHAERNVDVPATAFAVTIPEGAREMTLQELRASGPLADTRDTSSQ